MAESRMLAGRIVGAVHELEQTDAERRHSKAGLESTLLRLEERFNARHRELERLRTRTRGLNDANREIESYIERLSALTEDAATQAADASATLTLTLRTEMLPTLPRFEDVGRAELEAEDSPSAPGERDLDIPRIARGEKKRRRR
jgi:chromosome segregation ATPase